MDWFGYKSEWGQKNAPQPAVRIDALASRYNLRLGEIPDLRLDSVESHIAWFGREPFKADVVNGISGNLLMDPRGTLDGHNLMYDGGLMDALRLDGGVPLSPLFVRDLAGRTVYTGYGPERKSNVEWAGYFPSVQPDGTIAADDVNIFIPLCTFPLHCRDVQRMPGEHLLETVFLTKFRQVEMSLGYWGLPSGAGEEDEPVGVTYLGPNLYPYKLRPDTFYIDGWKLPQTQMLFARGAQQGVDVERAVLLGEKFVQAWKDREAGTDYEDWLEATYGKHELGHLFENGCTVIPTFEACNGYNVVNRDFELTDYWPGRAVWGLHDVLERREDKAPEGTILQVLSPGYITAHKVVPAQVVVSDGSGYKTPNGMDPVPFIPNLALPHQRTVAAWGATWVPTHPAHFETPALWGWEPNTGRFLQMNGPLWDPLHYYYASVDEILAAFENPLPQDKNRWLVPVPEHMHNRFYPVVPMQGFDVLSEAEMQRRKDARLPLRSSCKRVAREDISAGIAYHPLPVQFEFELDVFWFPEFHPLNREQGPCPEELLEQLVPVVTPRMGVKAYLGHVEAGQNAPWLADEALLLEPVEDTVENYPQLTRYVAEDMEIDDILKVAPVPYLSDIGDLLKEPVEKWWLDDDGNSLDGTAAMARLLPNVREELWTMREKGAEWVRLRHLLYQTEMPIYTLGWWSGANLDGLQQLYSAVISDDAAQPQGENAQPAAAVAAMPTMAEEQV